MDVGISPFSIKIVLESNPRKSTMLVGGLGVPKTISIANSRKQRARCELAVLSRVSYDIISLIIIACTVLSGYQPLALPNHVEACI